MLRNETCRMYPDSLYNTSLSNTKEERLKSRQIRGLVYPDEALSPIFDISSHVIHEINIDYFMVGERVRFLFTSCGESNERASLRASEFVILHNE